MSESNTGIETQRGRFITLEGGEGTGKSTQTRLLVTELRKAGFEALATREPGGSPRAEELRRVLLSGALASFGPKAEALVFSAARVDHLDAKIRPALARGSFVVCDRFIDSTRAYQGSLGNLDPRFIRVLESVVVGDTRPDLTFVLDVDPEIGLARAAARRSQASPDRFEREDLAFHLALRSTFLDIAAAEPERCVVVDASLAPEAIAEIIWQTTVARLLTPSGPQLVKAAKTGGELAR